MLEKKNHPEAKDRFSQEEALSSAFPLFTVFSIPPVLRSLMGPADKSIKPRVTSSHLWMEAWAALRAKRKCDWLGQTSQGWEAGEKA